MSNKEIFYSKYLIALGNAFHQAPHKFFYGPDEIPEMARRMVNRLADGTATISPTVKAVSKDLGIDRPGVHTIQAYLNEGSQT